MKRSRDDRPDLRVFDYEMNVAWGRVMAAVRDYSVEGVALTLETRAAIKRANEILRLGGFLDDADA